MCTQDIFEYACGHFVDANSLDRCTRALENNLPRCSDLHEQHHPVPEICSDCNADDQLNTQLEAALQQSAQDFSRKQEEIASAMGAVTTDEDEEEIMRKILDMSFEEQTRKAERDEAEMVRKAMEESKREWMMMPQTMDNWTQRAKGYEEAEDQYNPGPASPVPSTATHEQADPSSPRQASPMQGSTTVTESHAEHNAAFTARSRWAQVNLPPVLQPRPVLAQAVSGDFTRDPLGLAPSMSAAFTAMPSATRPRHGRPVPAVIPASWGSSTLPGQNVPKEENRILVPSKDSESYQPAQSHGSQKGGLSIKPLWQVKKELDKTEMSLEYVEEPVSASEPEKGDCSEDDEPTPPPSPRTMRARRMAAFDKRVQQ